MDLCFRHVFLTFFGRHGPCLFLDVYMQRDTKYDNYQYDEIEDSNNFGDWFHRCYDDINNAITVRHKREKALGTKLLNRNRSEIPGP